MSDKVRAAVIGLGWPGKEHVKGYQACADAELVALCDINESLLKQVAGEYGVERTYADYREMIACGDIDVVSVCVPNFLHADLTMDSLKSGKHVLCEKPPALNAGQARAMADAAQANDKLVMYAVVMRFFAETAFVKSLIDAGELGEIYIGKAGYTRRRGIPMGAGAWFIDSERAGGGALIDIGVHALDCIWYLMGTPKPVSVSGSAYTKFAHTVPEGVKYDVDDSALALIKFENGATLYLEATWAWNLPGGAVKMVAGTKGGAQLDPLKIYTEKNGVSVDTTLGGGDMPEGYGGGLSGPFAAEVAHFVSAVRGETELMATAEQGVQLMEMLDAVYESGRTGREVRL